MRKTKQILSLLFVALFISYYASAIFFVHTHTDESGKVFTHSHPYSSAEHTHSANALLLINNLTTLLFIGSVAVVCVTLFPVVKNLFCIAKTRYATSLLIGGNSLRAPPAL